MELRYSLIASDVADDSLAALKNLESLKAAIGRLAILQEGCCAVKTQIIIICDVWAKFDLFHCMGNNLVKYFSRLEGNMTPDLAIWIWTRTADRLSERLRQEKSDLCLYQKQFLVQMEFSSLGPGRCVNTLSEQHVKLL